LFLYFFELFLSLLQSLQTDVSSINFSYNGFSWKDFEPAKSFTRPPAVSIPSSHHRNNNTLSNATRLTPSHHYHPSPHPVGTVASSSSTSQSQALTFSLPDYFSISYGKSSGLPTNSDDPNFFRIKNLFTRLKALQKKETVLLSSINEQDIYSLALRWKNLCKELLQLSNEKEKSVTKELVDLYYQVLIDYQYFYTMGLGKNDEKWNEFVIQQEVSNLQSVYTGVSYFRSLSRFCFCTCFRTCFCFFHCLFFRLLQNFWNFIVNFSLILKMVILVEAAV
jgi:hypothetical protein